MGLQPKTKLRVCSLYQPYLQGDESELSFLWAVSAYVMKIRGAFNFCPWLAANISQECVALIELVSDIFLGSFAEMFLVSERPTFKISFPKSND